MKQVVLEQSTNTHKMGADKIKASVLDTDTGLIKLEVEGKGIVTHGEHGTLVTEAETVFKYVQQEFNPVTKKLQNAFD